MAFPSYLRKDRRLTTRSVVVVLVVSLLFFTSFSLTPIWATRAEEKNNNNMQSRYWEVSVTFTINFRTVPAERGTITFAGVGYDHGSSVSKGAGTYSIAANPAVGYVFVRWETEGGISVLNSDSSSTTCTVVSGGTLTMVQESAPPKCIIATAAYGSEIASAPAYMRHVRDNMIGSNKIGRAIIDGWNAFYYSWSPPIAKWISGSQILQAIFRVLLLPLVFVVGLTALVYTTISPINSSAASLVAFLFAAASAIATYVAAPLLTALAIYQKKSAGFHRHQ